MAEAAVQTTPAVDASKEDVWHCVIVGRNPGIYHNDAAGVQANTMHIPSASVLTFRTQDKARAAFAEQLARRNVRRVLLIKEEREVHDLDLTFFPGLDPTRISQTENKYYVVTVGREPGIFPSGYNVQANIANITGATSKTVRTYVDAVNEFEKAIAAKRVIMGVYQRTDTVLIDEDVDSYVFVD